MPFDYKEEWDFITKKMSDKFKLAEKDTYLPPEVKDGILKSAILVSESVLIEPSNGKDVSQQEVVQPITSDTPVIPMQQEDNIDSVITEDVGDELRSNSVETGEMDVQLSEVGEEGGDSLGGSVEAEGTQDISAEGIRDDIPRSQLSVATQEDKSLEPLRRLAELGKEGYHVVNDILFRSRLDYFGQF